jgi:hypothetical protein
MIRWSKLYKLGFKDSDFNGFSNDKLDKWLLTIEPDDKGKLAQELLDNGLMWDGLKKLDSI